MTQEERDRANRAEAINRMVQETLRELDRVSFRDISGDLLRHCAADRMRRIRSPVPPGTPGETP